MKKIIHVNQQVIARNRKTGANDPPLICRTYRKSHPAQGINIQGPSMLINSPHKPLRCGARVWIETEAPIGLLDNDGKWTFIS